MNASLQNLNKGPNEVDRYLCFNLGNEAFAIPLLTVKEVIGLPKVTPVPQSSPNFLGVIDLRGTVVSIIDIRKKFNIKASVNDEATVIILDCGDLHLGVLVDCVNSVLSMPIDQIKQRPSIDSAKTIEHITGVFRKDDQLILLLDIAKVLSVEDKTDLKNLALKNSA